MKILNCRLCIYLLALSFFMTYNLSAIEYPIPESEKAVDDLIGQVVPSLSKKYKMKAFGTAIAMPGGTVKGLGLRFHLLGPLSVEALRKILVEAGNDFLQLVNADERVRPFLEVYPFTLDRIEVVLFLIDSKRFDLESPDVGTARIRNGVLSYEWILRVKGRLTTQKELKESYAEALKALQDSSK